MGPSAYPHRSCRDGPVPFPRLRLGKWRATRDALHGYARVVGKVRAALAPKQKHWWHTSLQTAATGLTTTPIPVGARTLVLTLDMVHHRLAIATNLGEETLIPLRGQPLLVLFEDTLSALARLDIEPDLDPGGVVDGTSGTYDAGAVERYWRALSRIDGVFKRFQGTLRQETSPVQLFTHHFDLSLNWFSGRLVPGMDPADEDQASVLYGRSTRRNDSSASNPGLRTAGSGRTRTRSKPGRRTTLSPMTGTPTRACTGTFTAAPRNPTTSILRRALPRAGHHSAGEDDALSRYHHFCFKAGSRLDPTTSCICPVSSLKRKLTLGVSSRRWFE